MMIQKLGLEMKYGNAHISMLYPGLGLNAGDSGIGSLGRIDQANIHGGTTIKMHPHVNDEILSYFRTGKVIHSDSAGITKTIGRGTLMLMKAGKVFYHEEKILDGLEGLQIFIRPTMPDDVPEVLFYELQPEDSINTWRLLASHSSDTYLRFTSETEVYDMKVESEDVLRLPETKMEHAMYLLYAFQGSIIVNDSLYLSKGESVLTDEHTITFAAKEGAEVVLFVTNQHQLCYKEGMFSGNKSR